MYIGEADSQEPYAVFMLDATNAFNKLNRPQALARARKLWPSGCLYSYNSYRGPVLRNRCCCAAPTPTAASGSRRRPA